MYWIYDDLIGVACFLSNTSDTRGSRARWTKTESTSVHPSASVTTTPHDNNNEQAKQKITHLPMDILYDKQKGLDGDITQLNEYIPFDVGSAIEYQR